MFKCHHYILRCAVNRGTMLGFVNVQLFFFVTYRLIILLLIRLEMCQMLVFET